MRCCRLVAFGLSAIIALAAGDACAEQSSDEPGPVAEVSEDADMAIEDVEAEETHDEAAAHDEAAGHEADEHGGAHHDPYDLSHLNAAPKLEDPSEFRSDLAIWTLVVFLCLLALLAKFAWRPVLDGLDKRERSIASMIDEAKRNQEQTAEQLRAYEARMAAATEEFQKIVADARREGEVQKEQILADAQEAAKRERERAVSDIENAKNTALQEMTQKSVDLAVLMAGQIVQRQLNREDHARLIRDALDQLPGRN